MRVTFHGDLFCAQRKCRDVAPLKPLPYFFRSLSSSEYINNFAVVSPIILPTV